MVPLETASTANFGGLVALVPLTTHCNTTRATTSSQYFRNISEPFRVAGAVVAVQPRGWRRTRDGWENSTTWGTSLASLGDIVRQQQEREPGWVKALLAGVRSIPPWAYAMFQILAITCILLFERRATYHPGSE